MPFLRRFGKTVFWCPLPRGLTPLLSGILDPSLAVLTITVDNINIAESACPDDDVYEAQLISTNV